MNESNRPDLPSQWRKKPVVISAMQWDGTIERFAAILHWADLNPDKDSGTWVEGWAEGGQHKLVVRTLEGTMTPKLNDWLIKGVKGEFYFCDQSIFDATYDKA